MKINDFKTKIIVTVICLCAVVAFNYFGFTCIYMSQFNIPCPGCGMTRAFISAMKLDFAKALSYNFMFWSVPVLYLYFLFDGKLFKNKYLNNFILIFIGIGFITNWIFKLMKIC